MLDGVVRDSCLALAREWGGLRVSERYPTMAELREAIGQRRVSHFGYFIKDCLAFTNVWDWNGMCRLPRQQNCLQVPEDGQNGRIANPTNS